MDDFKTLREYQIYLRDRMEAARLNSSIEKVILFGFVSGGRNFLIDGRDVLDVHQMSTLGPIPAAKPWAIGAANIKGSVMSVTDFSVLMGGERSKKGKFMVLTNEIMPGAAIMIESISGLFDQKEIGEMMPIKNAELPGWIVGVYQIGQQYFMVDSQKLIADDRFSKLQIGDF